MKEIFVYLK